MDKLHTYEVLGLLLLLFAGLALGVGGSLSSLEMTMGLEKHVNCDSFAFILEFEGL